MNKQFLVAIPMVVILIMLGGCAIGYDTLMFVSKTNAGFEIDTQPPSIQVSIDRLESVVAPSYEEGKTPPVLGSFQFNGTGGLLATGMGSAFAAGDAALAMTVLYSAADYHTVMGVKQEIGPNTLDVHKKDWKHIDGKDEGAFNSGLRTLRRPTFPRWLPDEVKNRQPWEVRPLMFGTDTTVGLKVAWSGLTAQLPDTVRLGFSRKELAIAPVTLRPETEGGLPEEPHIAQAPSLLATTDLVAAVSGFLDTSFNYIQYFATGRAATALSLRHAVRQSMIKRFDPVQIAAVHKARLERERARPINARKATTKGWLGDTTLVNVADLQTEASRLQGVANGARQSAAGVTSGPDPLLTGAAEAQTAADAAKELADAANEVAKGLGPPPPSTVKQGDINKYRLLKWIEGRGYKVPVDKWLDGASLQELDLAIHALEIQ